MQEIEPWEGISKDELLRTAAMAENGSTHPIGLSILSAYKNGWKILRRLMLLRKMS